MLSLKSDNKTEFSQVNKINALKNSITNYVPNIEIELCNISEGKLLITIYIVNSLSYVFKNYFPESEKLKSTVKNQNEVEDMLLPIKSKINKKKSSIEVKPSDGCQFNNNTNFICDSSDDNFTKGTYTILINIVLLDLI